MKPILLAALALPLVLTGCATYVGTDEGPGYPGYYDGVSGDVAVFGYNRDYYHPHYQHYDGGYHSALASRSFSHESHVASVSHGSAGHSAGVSHSAAVSSGAPAIGGGAGHSGGGHR